MFLSRLAALCALVTASAYAFAADPNAKTPALDLNSSLEAAHLVSRIPRIHATSSQIQTDEPPGILWEPGKSHILTVPLSEYTCLKLRSYRVKRQESFREGESGAVGYSSCQPASNYQLRSAIAIH